MFHYLIETGWSFWPDFQVILPGILHMIYTDITLYNYQGPVVQSILSLTSSLRRQLVKCLTTF